MLLAKPRLARLCAVSTGNKYIRYKLKILTSLKTMSAIIVKTYGSARVDRLVFFWDGSTNKFSGEGASMFEPALRQALTYPGRPASSRVLVANAYTTWKNDRSYFLGVAYFTARDLSTGSSKSSIWRHNYR